MSFGQCLRLSNRDSNVHPSDHKALKRRLLVQDDMFKRLAEAAVLVAIQQPHVSDQHVHAQHEPIADNEPKGQGLGPWL